MTAESTSASVNTVGARAAVVRNLKILRAPEEGGTKKEYDDFLDNIISHGTIVRDFGSDSGHLLKNMKNPVIPKSLLPFDLFFVVGHVLRLSNYPSQFR